MASRDQAEYAHLKFYTHPTYAFSIDEILESQAGLEKYQIISSHPLTAGSYQ